MALSKSLQQKVKRAANLLTRSEDSAFIRVEERYRMCITLKEEQRYLVEISELSQEGKWWSVPGLCVCTTDTCVQSLLEAVHNCLAVLLTNYYPEPNSFKAARTDFFSRSQFEFISYDGEYPHLCGGELVIREINSNTLYHLQKVLCSAGGCLCKGEDTYEIIKRPWVIDDEALPSVLLPYIDEITKLVNENVEYGCCGGCADSTC